MSKSKIIVCLGLFIIMMMAVSCNVVVNDTHYRDGEVRVWMENDPENGVNIVVLGDGYIYEDLYKETGAFDVEVNRLMEFFFSKKPYSGYIDSFNVYVVYAESKDRGADDSPDDDNKDTVFNSSFNCYDIERLLLIQDTDKADDYILEAVDSLSDAHIVMITVNDDRYGGSGGYYSTTSAHELSTLIMLHEIGHSFGKLTDEYTDEALIPYYPIEEADNYPNVDRTDNLSTIKWNHFIGLEGYEMVGAYEGGFYRTTDIWRPEESCVMRALSTENFCAPCRESIVKNICLVTGVAYDFQDFLDKDDVTLDFKDKSFFETFAK